MTIVRRAHRLLVMVWDGMRPDMVRPELTPNLAALAARGVTFENCHATVPTVTRCNAATLATGTLPAIHGLPANILFAPKVDPSGLISLGEEDTVQRLRAAYGVFAAPTIADAITDAGGRVAVIATGTRGSAQMLYPNVRERRGLILHPTLTSDDEFAPYVDRLGPPPLAGPPDTARNYWFTRAAAEIVIPEQRPEALFFWHGEPDKSQHRFGFGHPESVGAIRAADRHLGLLLNGLESAGMLHETVVAVASDHGYVGVRGRVNLADELARVADGERIVVAPNGCAALVYQPDGDDRDMGRVVERLEAVKQVGVIFSGARGRTVLDGTFSLPAIGVDGRLAPDLLVGLRWSDDANEHGYHGLAAEHGTVNLASHGGTSPHEIRNTLIVAGPGIKAGEISSLAAGSVDLAPTVLALLGLSGHSPMQGRVLSEALVDGPAAGGGSFVLTEARTHVEQIESRRGRAWLRWTEVAGQRYLDAAGLDPT